MHAHYTKCNTNVHWGESGKVVVWKGGYHAYTSKGMERHAPRKWGQGLRGNVAWEAPCLTGGFSLVREEGYGTARVSRVVQGGGKGVEWNGMESSVVPVGWGDAEGPRGPKIDNAIPRLPLSPSTQLAPALLSFLLLRFSCPLLLPRLSLSLPPVVWEPTSFRNVNSINVTPFLFFFSLTKERTGR